MQQPMGDQPRPGPSGPRAGFWIRFAGALIDVIIITAVELGLTAGIGVAGSVISILVAPVYYTALEGSRRGQTVGKMAVGIRVISYADGGPIGYGRAFIRWIGRILSGVVILLGYLWMLWDRERQTWHDKLANAVVVPVEAYPL